MKGSLPISAMVVGYNESRLLEDCLSSIGFCNEIVYTDLGSNDNSIEVASKFATKILTRPRVPSCEMIQTEIVNLLVNDWVIFIDPDEKLDESLADQLIGKFSYIISLPNIGAVMVPWQFYFMKRKLEGTPWGGINMKFFLVNRNRFRFDPMIHYGRKLMPGFETYYVQFDGRTNVLHHYWIRDFWVFIRKHIRYLKHEGVDRYKLGQRMSLKGLIVAPFKEFHYAYISKMGFKDGILGLLLSIFWMFYQSVSLFKLYSYSLKKDRVPASSI